MENDKIIQVIVGDKIIADEIVLSLSAEGYVPIEVINIYDYEKQHVITENLFSKRTFFVGIISFFSILLLQDLTVKSYIEVMVGGKEFQSAYGLYVYFVPISVVGAILISSIYSFLLFLRNSNLLSWKNATNFTQIKGGETLIKYNYQPDLEIKLHSFKLLHEGGVNIS